MSQENSPNPDAPQPKRRRRRWPWVILALVLVLVLLIALAPQIASTGPVRGIVVGQINQKLNGTVEIADWSLSWTGPTTVSGVKVYDQDKRLILDVPRVKLGLSLLGAMRSNFAFGDDNVIDVDSFVVRVDQNGETNLEKLAKTEPSREPTTPPGEPPNVSGKFTVNFRGTVEGAAAAVHVEPSSAVVNITDIHKPIENSIKLVYRVGDGEPGTIQTSGTIQAVGDIAASQKLSLSNVNIAAAEPFVPDMKFGGIASGELDVKTEGAAGLSASGNIVVQNLLVGGGPLGEDRFQTTTLSMPVSITRTVVDANTTLIKIEKLNVEMPQATVAVSGQVSEQALQNLAASKPPGSQGSISLKADVTDLPDIARQLRHTLRLRQGVAITGGAVHQELTLGIEPQRVVISQILNATVSGTNNGRSVAIQPVTITAGAVALPTGQPLPDVRDIQLDVASAFATVRGGGESLSKLNITGNVDLAKLQSELSQFADMGDLQLQGAGDFAFQTSGDITDENAPILASANANFQNLKIGGVTEQQLPPERLTMTASGKLARKQNSPVAIEQGYVAVVSGEPNSPLIDLEANGNVDLVNNTVPWFEVKKLAMANLPALQQRYGGLVRALAEQGIKIESGALQANAAGSYDGKMLTLAKPVSVSLTALTVNRNGRAVLSRENARVSIDGGLNDLSVNLESSLANATIANARLATEGSAWDILQGADIDAQIPDIPKLQAVVDAFAASPAAPADALQVTGGSAAVKLRATRATATRTTTIQLTECTVSKLAVRRGEQEYRFDAARPITLKLAAAVQAGQALESVTVNELAGDLGVARLSMTAPIVAKNLAATPDINGGIRVEGSLAQLAPLLSVVQGMELPYQGDYVVVQNVTTQADRLTLDGNVTATQFKVLQDGKPVFSEERVELANRVDVDLKAHSVQMQSVSLAMPSSQALDVKLAGGIDDWAVQRQFKNVQMDVTYDLAKIWPIVHPMLLTPGEEDQFKDVKVAGKYTKRFTLAGSFPARPTFGESIKTVDLVGDITIDQLDAMGLNVQNWQIPLTLRNGQLAIRYADKPREERFAPPAACNGGKLDVAGATLDLSQDEPRLTTGKRLRVLQGVTINPLLGDTLGKYVNPVFTNTQRAQGLLDVTVEYCEGVALGEKLKSEDSGRAKVAFSLSQMDIANPLGSLMLGPVVSALKLGSMEQSQADTFQGQIKDATVTLERGVANTDVTLMLADPAKAVQDARSGEVPKPTLMPLSFKGDVRLADLRQNLDVSLPAELVARFVPSDKSLGSNLSKMFPQGIPIALRGTTLKPKVDVGDIAGKFIEGQIKTGGEGLLEGVLEQLGDKDKDRNADQNRRRSGDR